MQPVFTTNDAEVTTLEGLYIQERNPPAAITGVGFNKVAVCGTSVRGPVDRAVFAGTPERFAEVWGGRDQGSGGPITSNLWKALINKPFSGVWAVRVAAAAAGLATVNVTGAASATGTITNIAKASHVDAETVTISDGVLSKVYEFDVAGNGVTGGNVAVNISGSTTSTDVANALASAISTSGQNFHIAIAANVITLTNKTAGVAGNVAITDTVVNGSFTTTGMSGGTASGTVLARIDATSKGEWGNRVSNVVGAATDGNTQHFDVVATYLGKAYTYRNLDITPGNDNLVTVIGTDDGNIIAVTKIASGAPTAGTYALMGGSEGSIADSDYTATGRGINVVDAVKNVVARWVAEYSTTAVKDAIEVLAAADNIGHWLICPAASTTSATDAITEVATRRDNNGRIYYLFNHPYTRDPEAAVEIAVEPCSWMASVLSMIDVDINAGEEDTKPFLAGITRLSFPALSRGDYKLLRAAGIAALEEDEGFSFVSDVTTSLVPGKTQGVRRRITDYILHSSAAFLKHHVKKKNVPSRRDLMKSAEEEFLSRHQRAERVVDPTEDGSDNFSVKFLTTQAERGQGIERMRVEVRSMGHILHLVFEATIGSEVVIAREAA